MDADAALLAQIAQGDALAIKQMVAHKLPRILALAMRLLGNRAEAEDVAQETFLRIWKHAADWQTGEAKFDTWVHRVALNLCYDRLRGHKEHATQALDDEANHLLDLNATPDESLMLIQQKQSVTQALAALPNRQREALVLQYYQALSNTEAASLMDISVEALESLLSRARRNMRVFLMAQAS